MDTKEWALILFTVLSQTAIGAFILTTWFRERNKDEATDAIYRKIVWTMVPVVAVAILASLLHLGRPVLALAAMKNFATSWLSREVVFSGAFFVLVLASALSEKIPATRRVLAWLAAAAGVGSVISMAGIYDRAMMPAWQGYNTYLTFFLTAALLGAIATAGLLVYFGRGTPMAGTELQTLVWVGIGAMLIQAVAYPVHLVTLAGGGKAAQEALRLLSDQYALLVVARWVLLLGGGLVPLVLIGRRIAAGKGVSGLVYAGLLSLMAGELVGRFLFYASGVQITIGLM